MKKTKQKKVALAKSRPRQAAKDTHVKRTEVKITPAKGRPMLVWVGKRPLSHVTAFPAQHIESFDPIGSLGGKPSDSELWKDWPTAYPKNGLLFHGDNKEVLAHLLANGFRGKVKLIYIDPPFDSGADYVRKVSLRGAKGTAKLDGESYTLGEQIQYTDIWANDNYLQFMYERLLLLKELLAEDGWLILHCDFRRNAYLRLVLEEIFGQAARNEVAWHYSGWNRYLPSGLNRRHDTLFFIGKGDEAKLNQISISWASKEEYVKARKQEVRVNVEGKEYVLSDAGGGQRVERLLEDAMAHGRPLDDVWSDIDKLNNSALENTGFETQKPEALLNRIIRVCSNHGDLVLDCFIGSGTTAAVAQKLGRRWVGCDINKGAIQTTSKRLQTIIHEQVESPKGGSGPAPTLPGMESDDEGKTPEPAQVAFTVWRVNDYDLAIQHNEAVNLACEHIGIQRTRTDAYFDGTLGRSLVKIIPFGHPLTPLDLEELRKELDARPEEDRSVTVVCLGRELAAGTWIEDWNRMRKGKEAVNRIEVIELRTDPKYGKFIKHEPARAKVKISRKNDKIIVAIEDFISPTILERLSQQEGLLLKPKIDDWRSMVDCVMIDPAYDGKIFNVILSDVPEKKTDLVIGTYELPAPNRETTVAVKIIDMLGEEVLVTQTVKA